MRNRSRFSYLASPLVRWGIVAIATALGAAWLCYKGPVAVVRITTPLPETVPFWYMLSAFPALGMLLADLVALFAAHGLDCRVVELGIQVGFLILVSNLRLALKLPISAHSLLFAYLILRRILIRTPAHSTAWIETAIGILLYIITGCVKLFWWSDPVTVTVGTLVALGQTLISFFVLRGYRARVIDETC